MIHPSKERLATHPPSCSVFRAMLDHRLVDASSATHWQIRALFLDALVGALPLLESLIPRVPDGPYADMSEVELGTSACTEALLQRPVGLQHGGVFRGCDTHRSGNELIRDSEPERLRMSPDR